jgi:hypothetical protein
MGLLTFSIAPVESLESTDGVSSACDRKSSQRS